MSNYKQSATLKALCEEFQKKEDAKQQSISEFNKQIEQVTDQIAELEQKAKEDITVDEAVSIRTQLKELETKHEILAERKQEKQYSWAELDALREKIIAQLIGDVRNQKAKAFEKAREDAGEALQKYKESLAKFYEINSEGREFIKGYESMLGKFFNETQGGGLQRNNAYIYNDTSPGVDGISEPQQIRLTRKGK